MPHSATRSSRRRFATPTEANGTTVAQVRAVPFTWSIMRTLPALLVLLASVPASAANPGGEARIAVVAFGECTDAGLIEATHNIQVDFSSRADPRFLSEEATAAPAGGLTAPSQDELRRVLDTGRNEFLNMEHQRAEKTLRSALPAIDQLPLGPQRWELYWETRAWLARIALHSGAGARSTEFLLPILRVQEDFQLSRVDFPPSLRDRLELTRSLLPSLPRFKLSVSTRNGQGQVYLNGFASGSAPFERRLPAGDYQVVVATGTRRSFVRNVSLVADTSLVVDLEREGLFSARGSPCFQLGNDRDERLRAAASIATALGVGQIVTVRTERLGGEDYVAAALVEIAKGREVREGRVRRDGGRLPPLRRLAQFVLTGEGTPQPSPDESVPATALAGSPAPTPTSGGIGWKGPVAYALWGLAAVLGGISAYEFVHAGDLERERATLVNPSGAFINAEAKKRDAELQQAISSAQGVGTGLAVGAGGVAVGGGAVFIWKVVADKGSEGPEYSATLTLAGNF